MKVKLILVEGDGARDVERAWSEVRLEGHPEKWADILEGMRAEVEDGLIDAYGVVEVELEEAAIQAAFARTRQSTEGGGEQ